MVLVFLKSCYYDIDDNKLLTEGNLFLSVAANLPCKPKVVQIKLTDYQKMDVKERIAFLEKLGIKINKAE